MCFPFFPFLCFYFFSSFIFCSLLISFCKRLQCVCVCVSGCVSVCVCVVVCLCLFHHYYLCLCVSRYMLYFLIINKPMNNKLRNLANSLCCNTMHSDTSTLTE